jgi:CubicO group peptidase (beta-lactamase class C family)
MRYTLFLLVSFSSVLLSAQSIAINKIKLDKKIDSIFQSYNNKNSPGTVITVIQNGKILTRKSYGLPLLVAEMGMTW